eukprot:GEMP01068945.1.p1 GENE.GEMP01068945.1~~GEMP01068945.1.p1  ORF type:complete len:154 (+),score=37.80 GEMP01068945.1:61-522(+)
MALRLGRRLFSNFHVVKSVEEYESLKASSKMLVGWYTSHFSAASKLYSPKFEELAKSYPQYNFFTCDVDDAPRAAYDSEITDVPMVSVQPLGMAPSGTWYDKTDLQVVKADEELRYDQILSRAKEVIDSVKFGETNEPAPAWRFDPATGTTTR